MESAVAMSVVDIVFENMFALLGERRREKK